MDASKEEKSAWRRHCHRPKRDKAFAMAPQPHARQWSWPGSSAAPATPVTAAPQVPTGPCYQLTARTVASYWERCQLTGPPSGRQSLCMREPWHHLHATPTLRALWPPYCRHASRTGQQATTPTAPIPLTNALPDPPSEEVDLRPPP
jgi:hypothetical protein